MTRTAALLVAASVVSSGCGETLAISPDGKTFAYYVHEGMKHGGPVHYFRLVTSPAFDRKSEKTIAAGEVNAIQPWFSPTGRELYYCAYTSAKGGVAHLDLFCCALAEDRTDRVLTLATLAADVRAENAESMAYTCSYSFSGDMTRLASASLGEDGRRYVMRVFDMKTKREMWTYSFPAGEDSGMGGPIWTHDGAEVAVAQTGSKTRTFEFPVFDAATGRELRRVKTEEFSTPAFAFYPGSRDLVAIDGNAVVRVSGRDGKKTTIAQVTEQYKDKLFEQKDIFLSDDCTERFAFSPSGRYLAVVRGGGDFVQALQFDEKTVYIVDLPKGTCEAIAWEQEILGTPIWTPDERHLLFGIPLIGYKALKVPEPIGR
jgi:hypothetical protein